MSTTTNNKTGTTHSSTTTTVAPAGTAGGLVSGNTTTEPVVKTGNYQTGLEHGGAVGMGGTVPVVGNSYQNRMAGGSMQPGVGVAGQGMATHTVAGTRSGDGLVVDNTMGEATVLGGQCECTMNGGSCSHGQGKCICRGCTTRATTVHPGINIGMSTTQYTAPVSTTGIGGGVADPGVGIAGVVHPTNASGGHVNPTDANCLCVKNGGTCKCNNNCECTNCSAKRHSMQHASTSTTSMSSHAAPIAGTEYASGNTRPDSSYRSTTAQHTNLDRGGAASPITDNSNYPYPAKDFTAAKPVTEGSSKTDPTATKPVNSNSGVV